MADAETVVSELVLSSYVTSGLAGSFNGLSACDERVQALTDRDSRRVIGELIRRQRIDCVFGRRDLNPYIKRLPELSVDSQLALLASEPLDTVCLYPTRSVLGDALTNELIHEPFSRALLLGAAQLNFVAFEMGVLGRYMSDPRYSVRFNDYAGTMAISDPYYQSLETLERDKTSIQSFGLGFDEQSEPYIIVFYRYLANLSPEHQTYWDSFRTHNAVTMSEPYFKSSILGEFWSNRSVRHAVQTEMQLINQMTMSTYGKQLFRLELNDNVPIDLSAFLVPTTSNYDRFIHACDKLLSENISRDFFLGAVELTAEQTRKDGRTSVIDKGTITLLDEWLALRSDLFTAGARERVIKPLREIRKVRQKPAHNFRVNAFSLDFHAQRRNMLKSIWRALAALRHGLAKLPASAQVVTPKWLDEEPIDIF